MFNLAALMASKEIILCEALIGALTSGRTTIVARALKELKSHALPKLVDSNSIDGGAGRRPPVPWR